MQKNIKRKHSHILAFLNRLLLLIIKTEKMVNMKSSIKKKTQPIRFLIINKTTDENSKTSKHIKNSNFSTTNSMCHIRR